jgi:hypothetical protein
VDPTSCIRQIRSLFSWPSFAGDRGRGPVPVPAIHASGAKVPGRPKLLRRALILWPSLYLTALRLSKQLPPSLPRGVELPTQGSIKSTVFTLFGSNGELPYVQRSICPPRRGPQPVKGGTAGQTGWAADGPVRTDAARHTLSGLAPPRPSISREKRGSRTAHSGVLRPQSSVLV